MSGRPVVLITGGSRGIGAATAVQAAAAGYDVALSYVRNKQAAEAVVEAVESHSGRGLAVQADVAVEADIINLFATTQQAFGRLDAFVNNAGVVDGKQRVDEMSAERLQRMMAINVVGPMLCAREAVKRMSKRYGGKGGAIVNVSSVAALLGSPGEYVDYAASKGALDVITIGLAKEVVAEGIRVNAVRPGIIDTEIHASGGQPDRVARVAPLVPMARAGRADEVAAAILYFMSEGASYSTGAFLNVSGGR
ncbi:SDR family oxidoreductase [Tianweitania sediminis]|uniref:SDR family oxidoreductase n=1 Tax=Tianweitania sediminis TaxID=1502156 RepID=A0A8J7R0L3_9HYPH|nr:SDR family oxidoreductase [Tianweitania sediminis]MBP0437821.1 SDR family oxidoreductase [Tianweitania sediminis]